jgi:hypothetical protein
VNCRWLTNGLLGSVVPSCDGGGGGGGIYWILADNPARCCRISKYFIFI